MSERIPCTGCTSEIYCEENGCKFPRASELRTHPTAQPAQPVAEKYVEGFLCRAWGETDLPEARLVRSKDEWAAFVAEAQYGAPPFTLSEEDADAIAAQVRYIEHDMADNGTGCIEFEIGGVSVERVTFLSPKTGEGSAIEGGDSTGGGEQ